MYSAIPLPADGVLARTDELSIFDVCTVGSGSSACTDLGRDTLLLSILI